MISGKDYCYIYYVDGSEELYDIGEDFYEWRNFVIGVDVVFLLERFCEIVL